MTGGLAFNYEDLRYIELKEPGSKFPARRWGGYSQDYADTEGVLEHVDETKHYGNVLGSNEFDDTRLGAVIGSNHYGDHYIKKWGAYAGEAVDLEPVDLDDLDGGEVDELARSVHYTWYFREIPAGGLVGRESRERPR